MFSIRSITEDIHELINERSEQLNIQLPANYENYKCPISTMMMFDPVIPHPCTHTLERVSNDTWQNQQRERKNEAGEEHPVTCCYCRRAITHVTSNDQLKREIDQFLNDTKNQLNQDISNNPAGENNPMRQELVSIINNFLKYGNHPSALKRRVQAKLDKSLEELARGNFRESIKASSETSSGASRLTSLSCRIL